MTPTAFAVERSSAGAHLHRDIFRLSVDVGKFARGQFMDEGSGVLREDHPERSHAGAVTQHSEEQPECPLREGAFMLFRSVLAG